MPKVVLTGPVQLELLASYFREAGYDVPPGDVRLDDFKPDFVYDVTSHDAVLADEVADFRDVRLEKLSGCPYSRAGIRAIVDEFAWERLRSPRKILAVDADNTLWKGILSEDGADALVPYAEFQEGLKKLAAEGVVLVLLSKNDPFVLDWFTVCKVNWAPKAGNLLEACRELNLSPDSAVFVDDNPFERAQMADHLPVVAVPPFPADLTQPRQFLRRLKEYFFSQTGVTAEDRLRTRDYQANDLRNAFLSAGGYLDALELRVQPSPADEADLDRLAQMAGKTNQFNATTLRRTREEFHALLDDPRRQIWVFRTSDRFGEQGIVCYVVLDRTSGRVTDFVMSCRVLGRTLEYFVYDFVTRELGHPPVVDFVRTARNRPFADFLATLPNPPPSHFRFHGDRLRHPSQPNAERKAL